MMHALMMGAALVVGAVEAPAPVAMVLTTRGSVSLDRGKEQRPLRVMDLLRPGDVLVAAEGEAVLVLLADGHRERLKPQGQATVGATGCTPVTAIERQDKVKLSAVQLAGVRDLARSGRGAVGVLRGQSPATPQPVTPLYGATILSDRPTLTWRATDKADQYEVQLLTGDAQRVLWRATTAVPRLSFPEKQPALKPGVKYVWRVTARRGEDQDLGQIADSKFFTATKAEAAELASLKPLTTSDEPADLLLAATTYEAHGVHGEALALYEKLAVAAPAAASFQVALASYYERGGRMEEAKAARAKATKFGAVAQEK